MFFLAPFPLQYKSCGGQRTLLTRVLRRSCSLPPFPASSPAPQAISTSLPYPQAKEKKRTSKFTMILKRLLSSLLPITSLLLLTASTYARCENPSVRREWRQFSTDEKAEWISAVKVSLLLLIYRVVMFHAGVHNANGHCSASTRCPMMTNSRHPWTHPYRRSHL